MTEIPNLDNAAETGRIARFLVETVSLRLKRRGLVLGVSGGVDSAVSAALAAMAVGRERVFALLMPERECSDGGLERARRLCRGLGIRHEIEDITPALEAVGCYHRRDEAIRAVFPDYGTGWRHKVAIAGMMRPGAIPHFVLVVESPDGHRRSARMPAEVYTRVVAATNFKQRIRKALEYYHAERLSYAVLGTPNRLEYELGFFVRGGDGLADIKPIAHLYKTQVYALAAHLGIPEDIRSQPPTTDTYSLPQTQEEFYFGLPTALADRLLHAYSADIPPPLVARQMGMTEEQVEQVYRDFAGKKRVAARSLRDAYVLDAAP